MLQQKLDLRQNYKMNIISAKYYKNVLGQISAIVMKLKDDPATYHVPLVEDNTDYAEILKQVKEGTLTIKDAD